MNFCERLREIRNELKTIEVLSSQSTYNLGCYVEDLEKEVKRLERNLAKFTCLEKQLFYQAGSPLTKEDLK